MSVPVEETWDFSCGNNYHETEKFTGYGEQSPQIRLEVCGLWNFLECGKGTAENSNASYNN